MALDEFSRNFNGAHTAGTGYSVWGEQSEGREGLCPQDGVERLLSVQANDAKLNNSQWCRPTCHTGPRTRSLTSVHPAVLLSVQESWRSANVSSL